MNELLKTPATANDLESLAESDETALSGICRALSSVDRIKIVRLLAKNPQNLLEISKKLSLPISSVSKHIDMLAAAKIVQINYQPGLKGHCKLCTLMISSVTLDLLAPEPAPLDESGRIFESFEMPIGLYSDFEITSPCGMAGRTLTGIPNDEPGVFFSPKRTEAELIWFNSGYLTYIFPNYFQKCNRAFSLDISLEICSETYYYREVWPSDITFYLNGVKLLTYTSPGDFGGRKGKFSPENWPLNSTHFGLLKTITINQSGTFFERKQVAPHTIESLGLRSEKSLKFKIEISEESVHCGGINIFGKNWGDYNQSILMKFEKN